MKNGNARRFLISRFHYIILFALLVTIATIAAIPVSTVKSSAVTKKATSAMIPSSSGARIAEKSGPADSRDVFLGSPMMFDSSIATFANDCIVPQTDFVLGEQVCAKASGAPDSLFFPWKIAWVDPVGFIRQTNTASSDPSTEYHFTIPSTETSEFNGQTVDNRGTWRVNLTRFNGAIQQTASFTVHETANPVADVSVQKFQRDPNQPAPAGGNVAFVIVIANQGPDPAAAVHLVDSPPSGTTLTSFTQNSGPPCVPLEAGVPNDCSIATLTNGDRAEFTAVYGIPASEPPGTVLTTSSTVSSTTTDPNPDNNTSSAQFQTDAAAGAGTCSLVCPSDITAQANTTEGGQRGAHVTYPDPEASGDCGSVSSTPPSGSFFPVGTTVVHATSETGGGECAFSVTVEDNGSNVNISCPSSKTADADSSCSATVDVGTATATGDNVTITATRSDGQPMYTCDANGTNCTRNSSDAPFSAGTTTITWIAYSHDTPGPYANPDDEESHRTGSAQCNQTVTVNDVTPPTITATNSSASADANCQAPVPDYKNSVTDNCACTSSDTSEACAGHARITVTQDPAPGTMVGLGSHTVHITANDGSSNNGGAGNTSTKDVTFTVNDTTPPTISCPANMSANTLPGTCAAVVVVGTATATDNCDSNPTITASRSDGRPLTDTYPKGTTTITWTATDDAGNSSSCTQTITVVDNSPPVIVFNGQTPSMWPPNHKYQTFGVTNFVTSVTDNCDSISVSSVYITKVTSDEIENGNGDGNTLNDIVIASDCKSVQLRSEREGNSDGRVYTIFFSVADSSGNVGTGTAKVVVRHNPGETAVDSGPHYTVMSNCP